MKIRELLRHIFTPHISNNQRARALHPSSIFLYILLFIFLQQSLQAVHNINPNLLGYATDIRVEELLKITNEKRKENGLPPLRLNEKLSEAARRKAFDMFNKNYWAHVAPDGVTPWSFILQTGYDYSVAGENLAKNFETSKGVVDAWMASPTHKENIIKPDYVDIGFAVVDGKLQGEETTLVVQMFGKEKGERLAHLQKVVTNQTAPVITTPKTTPIPTEAALAEVPEIKVSKIFPYEIAGVYNNPVFDIRTVDRQLSLFLLLFLTVVLVIDGYFVIAHKKVRIAGRNWAHLIFIACVGIIIYIAQTGSIL